MRATLLPMAWIKRLFDLKWLDDHSALGLECAQAAVDLSIHG